MTEPGAVETVSATLAQVQGAVCDVDGTLTDGRIFMTGAGDPLRAFSTRDGLGVQLLQSASVRVAWLTATTRGGSTQQRARMLGIPDDHVDVGTGDKGPRFTSLCQAIGLAPERVVYIGDDLNDLPAMHRAGLAACPADAHPTVREAVDIVLRTPGGHGAFRELADLILRARADA